MSLTRCLTVSLGERGAVTGWFVVVWVAGGVGVRHGVLCPVVVNATGGLAVWWLRCG